MINLASSSVTRARILKDFGISFIQIPFKYDENLGIKKDPLTYTYNIVKAKEMQFLKKFPDLTNVLFADSVVVVNNQIYGKAKDDAQARDMLLAQSGNLASVVSSFIFIRQNLRLENTSITTYKFKKFDTDEIDAYIKSKDCYGKAGAMMIEGFNKKYIISQVGNTSTAMGLNAEILKAYLCL